MKTIVIVGGIVLAGASVIALVQMDKKKDQAPAIMQTQGSAETGSSSGTPLINPAHGLAGHRCDLPVGAPLTAGANASATSPSSPNVVMNPAAVQPQGSVNQPSQSGVAGQVSQPVAAAPVGMKINPAHGQPGHRCDIAVGAPLSSAPAANPVKPAQPNMNVQPQSGAAQTPAVSAGGKLNPAHGLPNHRCDIPVGAPLT